MKKNAIKPLLKSFYGIDAVKIINAPRGFVAETFIATAESGEKDQSGKRYFIKFVTKPFFKKKLLSSIATQHQIYEKGFARMNYPVKTLQGELCIHAGEGVMAVYNFVEGKQSYKYDLSAIGSLEADLHQVDPTGLAGIKIENFQSEEALLFPEVLKQIVNGKSGDQISRELTGFYRKWEAHAMADYEIFLHLQKLCLQQIKDFHFVITHGDIGGNTLMKSPTDLVIVDWDEIILAPAERDIWTLWKEPEFRKGYQKVLPSFTINNTLYRFYILMMHFTYLIHYINEINSRNNDSYRAAKLKKMEKEYTNGWIAPYLKIAREE